MIVSELPFVLKNRMPFRFRVRKSLVYKFPECDITNKLGAVHGGANHGPNHDTYTLHNPVRKCDVTSVSTTPTAHALCIELHALIAVCVEPWNWKLTRNFGDRPMGAWKS